MAFRGFISDQKAFAENRFDARGNYLYATGGVQRTQDLIAGTKLHVKVDGQVSDAPLINNEQFAGGGLESVRGYRETEALGDSAEHSTVELLAPEIAASHGVGNGKLSVHPFVFFDQAHLFVLDALPEQAGSFRPRRDRRGRQRTYNKCLEYETCWATALSGVYTNKPGYTKAGDNKVHFRVKYLY